MVSQDDSVLFGQLGRVRDGVGSARNASSECGIQPVSRNTLILKVTRQLFSQRAKGQPVCSGDEILCRTGLLRYRPGVERCWARAQMRCA